MEQRECKKCGKTKPFSGFAKIGNKTEDRRFECRECANARNRSYYSDESKERKFNTKLLSRYGITANEYWTILEKQNGGCAICGTKDNRGRRLAIDHCHTTNKIRGILCDDCNFAIGKLKDSSQLCRNAFKYLEKQ